MVETYIVRANGKILQVYETQDGLPGVEKSMKAEGLIGEIVLVPTPFDGHREQDEREFDADWKLRPIRDRVGDGLVTLPKTHTVDEETGEVRKKTLKESIDDGTTKLQPSQKYDPDKDTIIPKPWPERIADGPETYEDWLDAVVRPHRDGLLVEADTVYCNPERWWGYSDDQKTAWSAYKQALRDFPATKLQVVDDPALLAWPYKPV